MAGGCAGYWPRQLGLKLRGPQPGRGFFASAGYYLCTNLPEPPGLCGLSSAVLCASQSPAKGGERPEIPHPPTPNTSTCPRCGCCFIEDAPYLEMPSAVFREGGFSSGRRHAELPQAADGARAKYSASCARGQGGGRGSLGQGGLSQLGVLRVKRRKCAVPSRHQAPAPSARVSSLYKRGGCRGKYHAVLTPLRKAIFNTSPFHLLNMAPSDLNDYQSSRFKVIASCFLYPQNRFSRIYFVSRI